MANPIASVLVEGGPPTALDYRIPPEMGPLQPGMRVQVPLRGHLKTGIVQALLAQSQHKKLEAIAALGSAKEAISPDLWQLATWMAHYYATPLGTVLRTLSPPSLRKQNPKQQLQVKPAQTREALRTLCIDFRSTAPHQAQALDTILAHRGPMLVTELLERAKVTRSVVKALEKKRLITLEEVVIDRSPLKECEYFPTSPKPLNEEQTSALKAIMATQGFGTHLLHGVTGSGKTEVYLQAITQIIAKGKGAIMLVPEIALTSQMVERFRSRLHNHIAVLHHRLSDGERYDEWCRIQRGEAAVVIGARSAIFSPHPNLGLIIVDEEHEPTYKQADAAPRYHARNVAIMRGKFCHCPVVLGSATPSLESFYNARSGKFSLSTLNQRADAATLPKVHLVNIKETYEKQKQYSLFCDELLAKLKERHKKGEQSILFLNRRGYAAMQWCTACSQATPCVHCDAALTFHRSANVLTCHLCGYTRSPPKQCLKCGERDPVKYRGAGTEQVERALHAVLPELRVLRVDADTTKHKGSLDRLLRHFRTGRADVIVGTQMIAKGLHFPQVTLVGVLNSDPSLNLPDFRAAEVVFQLVTQVAGRAGRGEHSGEVIVQTAMPDHPILKLAAAQDYIGFYERESVGRARFGYPPFGHLIKLVFDSTEPEKAKAAAQRLHSALKLTPPHAVSPVIEAGYTRIKGRYRYQCLLQGPSIYHMNEAIEQALRRAAPPRPVRLLVDVDPTSTFF